MDYISGLPTELGSMVCENLSLKDLNNLRTTSWKQYNICIDALAKRIAEDMIDGNTFKYVFTYGNSIVRIDLYDGYYQIRQVGGEWPFDNIQYKNSVNTRDLPRMNEAEIGSDIKIAQSKNHVPSQPNFIKLNKAQVYQMVKSLLKMGYMINK